MKKNTKIFVFLVIICVTSVGIYLLFNNLTCQRLACLSLKNGSQYKIQKIYEDNKYTFRALYENGDILLRTEIRSNYSPQDSEQVIKGQIARTKGLFEDAAAPYPGEISDVISCSDEYKPVYSTKSQNGIQFSYFSGFINDRLVFGSCVNDQAKYKDTLVMFYCSKQKKFYQLEVIVPNKDSIIKLDQDQEILNSIVCRE